jgi:molybdopterin converting factor subunit 1
LAILAGANPAPTNKAVGDVSVNVRFFASLVQHAGCAAETVEIEPSMDVEALWDLLVQRHPALASLAYEPLVACDLEYADWSRSLQGVREVAFLPPVSGG